FTSLIAPSFLRVRSWVSSTDCVRLSTLPLTSPTLVLTNFFVAHAGSPTATTPASANVDIHFDIPCLLMNKHFSYERPPARGPATYPLRVRTTNFPSRTRTVSGCQPSGALD